MNVDPKNQQLIALVGIYWRWRPLWIGTTILFTVLGLVYALFLKGDTWVASQGLLIRAESNGAVMRMGRFESQTEMKAAQETILEMARNPQVLFEALQAVGREPSFFGLYKSSKPPTNSEIESLAKNGIHVHAPQGAEFGTTEMIYLDVKQSDPERAKVLNRSVCDALENRLQQVRVARAKGIISELTAARAMANNDLQNAVAELRQMERQAGTDLTDLRAMTDANLGGSSNKAALDNVKEQILQIELRQQQIATDLQWALASYKDPDKLLSASNDLLASNTGVRKLREGLSDAQIRTSQLKGRFTELHPLVIAAMGTQEEIQNQLQSEIGLVIRTLTKDLEDSKEQLAKLSQQQDLLEGRLGGLADVRADYARTVNDVRTRTEILQGIERDLTQAKAARDAAGTTSLLTRIDEPTLGVGPIGPGRGTIIAGTGVCGLVFGFGIVFLLTPFDAGVNYGRRQQDYSGSRGRRAVDIQSNNVAQASHQERKTVESSPARSLNKSFGENEPTAGVLKQKKTPTHDENLMISETKSSKTMEERPTPMYTPPNSEAIAAAQAVIAAALRCETPSSKV
ncbi:MAG: hypothetical protein KDB03_22355 [Planctomycetales bacterium]|nr:hypothetical protein [Planctomycetales bacterium]